MVKTVTVLGSTGSIGQSTVKLLAANPDKFKVVALTGHNNLELLNEQAALLKPEFYTAKQEEICQAATMKADIVIAGIVGFAGLKPTMAAIEAGNDVGLANKEAMVCAGQLMLDAAKKSGSKIIPVDSEHNAVFQVFDFDQPESVEKVVLTASGGPFLNYTLEELKKVTPDQAKNHPKWKMGAKISVDSATMMNKGLELIEAFNLFPVKAEQLDVVVHPESIIHSMVMYKDGSVLAQAASPDMCVPISYALNYPERLANNSKRLDLTEIGQLTFQKPDYKKFRCLEVARQVLGEGLSHHIVLNSANEVAVDKFLNGAISFSGIADVVEKLIASHKAQKITSISHVFALDEEVRKKASELCKLAA